MVNEKADLRNISISDIRENPVALRGVDKETDKYKSLRDSIASKGVLSAIVVREKNDPDGKAFYEIVDGLHRYSGAKDAGLTTLPVNVISQSDAEVLETQIIQNLCRVDTKPVEFTKQLQRMMVMNPTLTLGEVAARVNQSTSWVSGRLNLLKLDAKIQESVDNGDINVSNAQALSKLPKEEQFNFLEQAMTQQPSEFLPVVQERVKQLRDAARQGKAAEEVAFVAVSHLRGKKDLEAEMASPSVGPAMCSAQNLTTAAQGFAAAIKYVLSRDPDSEVAQKAKFDARNAEREAAKQKREQERAEKKATEARAAADAIKLAAGATA
jgi:ParB/RepB/Spo0J family partition protein